MIRSVCVCCGFHPGADPSFAADAFVALPGEIGTLEELVESYTWASSACTPSRSACSTSTATTTRWWRSSTSPCVRPEHRAALAVEAEADALLDRLDGAVLPTVGKWLQAS